jgi:hypothetical protein
VTTREKRPLLNFGMLGPDGREGFLLPRREIGTLQAGYLLDELAEAGLAVAGPALERLEELLVAICRFTPGQFENRRENHHGDQSSALAEYLTDGLPGAEPGLVISASQVDGWRQESEAARKALFTALDEPASDFSSAEEILLALPLMRRRPVDVEAIDELVRSYCTLVEQLNKSKAQMALRALADSGRRWLLIAELTVPLGERFAVKLREDRPLGLRFRHRSRQRFALGDAAGAHLEIRTPDPNVQLGRALPELRDVRNRDVPFGQFNDLRLTEETFSLYSSVEGRPRFLEVDVGLRLTPGALAMPLLVLVLGIAATVVCLLLPAGPDLVTALGVIVVPSTVAAALLSVREQTALAARLQARVRMAVVLVTVLLWVAVLVRLLWSGVALPPWRSSDSSTQNNPSVHCKQGEAHRGKDQAHRHRTRGRCSCAKTCKREPGHRPRPKHWAVD